jgi:hypothetical protein
VIHEHDNEEDAEPRLQAVVKEISIAILFVAGALVIAWLGRLFPGGKAPTLVYAFVILSDLILILGATLEFARALRTLLRPWGLFAGKGRRAVAPAPDSSGWLGGDDRRRRERVPFDVVGALVLPREPHPLDGFGRSASPERPPWTPRVGKDEPMQLEDRLPRPRVEARPRDSRGVEGPLPAARAQPLLQPPVRENVGRGQPASQQRWVPERGVAHNNAHPQSLHDVEPGRQLREESKAAEMVGEQVEPRALGGVAAFPQGLSRKQPAGSNEPEPRDLTGSSEASSNLGFWSVTLRGPDCLRYPPRVVRASIDNPDSFRSHLIGIARIEAPSETEAGGQWIEKYELEVRKLGTEENSPPLAILRWDESPLAAGSTSPREPAEHDHLAKVVDLRYGRTARAARE